MPQSCPRCNRANPDDALYCYLDGNLLRQGAGLVTPGQLSQEFVFPSGRRCKSYDDLVQGCYLEWEDARQLLHDGTFAGFLAGQGRADLARAARETQSQSDLDIALTNFINALPAAHVHGPKLGLNPRRLPLGPLRVGESRPVQVRVLNEGQAMLQGKLTVADGVSWLRLVDSPDPSSCPVRTPREQAVNLRVDTTGLVVGQNYSARLVVVTNGGVAEVPVRLDLAARPFAHAPYQGVTSPRDLARRMRDAPQPAVALLESGEVARWFAANGWTYPVAGGTAPGLAAVQQFFEELGLAKAPPVSISSQEVRLRCALPDVPTGQVLLRCATRKLVYGRAESDSPWLVPTAALVSGQMQAAIGFAVDPAQLPEDRTYEGTLKVVANAGQSFAVRVIVEVSGNRRGWFSAARSTPAPPPVPSRAPAYEPVLAGSAASTAPQWLNSSAGRQTESAAVLSPVTTPELKPVRTQKIQPVKPAPEPAPVLAPVGPVSPWQALQVGAVLGLLLRCLLVVPADLFARLLGGVPGGPPAGSLQAWLAAPPADEGFLRLFVLAIWWVGPILSVLLVWRQGGKWADLVCAALAGSVAGLAAAATLGCVLVAGDAVPRTVLSLLLGKRVLSAVAATPLWIMACICWWLILGGVVGLLLSLGGSATRGFLALAARPVSALLRLCGLPHTADFFDFRG